MNPIEIEFSYNSEQLLRELKAEGIQTCGCNGYGVVWDLENNEIQDRKDVKAIIAAHDPTPIPPPPPIEDRIKALETKLAEVETDVSTIKKQFR